MPTDNMLVSESQLAGAKSVRTIGIGVNNIQYPAMVLADSAGTLLDTLPVRQGQSLDAGNSVTVSSANASPGSPWVGTWSLTRTLGIVRQLVVLASTQAAGLGGTFTFEYSEDGSTATISEARTVSDFATVRDFDLLNAGAYFRVKFAPSRVLGAGELVFVTTTHRTQADGAFVRLANQEIEEANAALPQTFAYLKAFDPVTGKSVNIRPTALGDLRVSNTSLNVSQSGSLFTESIRDDVQVVFSASRGASDLANLVTDAGSVNGTATHDATEGQAVFATGATAGNTAYFRSVKTAVYEAGHMIRGEMAVQLSRALTGADEVRWGYGQDNGSGGITSGVGWGVDATGLFVWRRKGGADAAKTYRTSFNRDLLGGVVPSRFLRAGSPEAVNPLRNNLYTVSYEWFGVAPPDYRIMAPTGDFVTAHVEEVPNSGTSTTFPDPELSLFVRASNASGTNLQVRCGSWRGGVHTSKAVVIGRRPDGDYVDTPADGAAWTTTTALGASGVYTSPWQNSSGWRSIELVIVATQTSGTNGIAVDLTDDAGVGTPVTRFTRTFTYGADEVTAGFMVVRFACALGGFRVRYTNGGTPQGTFFMRASLRVENVELPQGAVIEQLSNTRAVVMTRGVLNASSAAGSYANIERGTNGGLDVGIVQHEVETPLKSLAHWKVSRASVTTSAASILTAVAGRRSLSLKAITSAGKIIYIAHNLALATTSAGFPLNNQESLDLEIDETDSIFAVADGGTQVLAIVEVYV